MSEEANKTHNQPKLSSALEEVAKHNLPFGLKFLVPWIKSQRENIKNAWLALVVLSSVLSVLVIWLTTLFKVAPLNKQLSSALDEKKHLELKLAPFQAAGERYFSSIPSAERLSAMLSVITNSAADVRELRRLQNRSAQLQIAMVGEGGGWNNVSPFLESNTVIYMPLFQSRTNIGIHFVLYNAGELVAETVHVNFQCSTQQICSAALWENQSSVGNDFSINILVTKLDALYPQAQFSLGAIRLTPSGEKRVSTKASLSIDAKNMNRIVMPLEFFFFQSKTNLHPFTSTNRLVWQALEAK